MAPGSAAAVALKAAAVASILAVLVLPSLARCDPSLGPEPPSPAPTPAPAISCGDDCAPQCYTNCLDTAAPTCSRYCDAAAGCEKCKTEAMNKQCTVACCNGAAAGECGCRCETAALDSCTTACFDYNIPCISCVQDTCNGTCSYNVPCMSCVEGYGQKCLDDCNAACASCVVK